MPLIIITGYPCAGKTYRSRQILQDLESRIAASEESRINKLKVHHVNDESLGLSRSVYHIASAEKDARAEEMSAVKRWIGRDSVVIADGLNYIKGYRYQLFCESKAVQTPSCVVHVGTSQEKCREYFSLVEAESPGRSYSKEDFENLLYRYEEPNAMSRWDSPLFTVLNDDATPPMFAIWEAIIGRSSAGSDSQPINVRPNAATVLKPASTADYLYELEKITSDTVKLISLWQLDHPGEEGGMVRISPGKHQELMVQLPSIALSLPQLHRLRRQFIALNRQHILDQGRIQPLFVDYLNDAFGT